MTKHMPTKLREGYDLLNYFYKLDEEELSRIQQSSFRDDIFRLVILHFHLAIEELLKSFIFQKLPNRRTLTAKQNIKYVEELSSKNAIELAARLGIINKNGYEALIELNTIRNKCSHHWVLNAYTLAKKPSFKQKQRERKYRIEFQGKSLLNLNVMKNEFMPLYSDLYLELFAIRFGLRWKRKFTSR